MIHAGTGKVKWPRHASKGWLADVFSLAAEHGKLNALDFAPVLSRPASRICCSMDFSGCWLVSSWQWLRLGGGVAVGEISFENLGGYSLNPRIVARNTAFDIGRLNPKIKDSRPIYCCANPVDMPTEG